MVAKLRDGEVMLLENLRFHKGEESNNRAFAKQLAALGDLYVNDAFSAAHRAHASTEGVAHLLPSYAGRLMEAELKALEKALDHPQRPVAALVGGAKVSTKLAMLHFLVAKVEILIIGGAMANTLLMAEGRRVGKSLVERDLLDSARCEDAAHHLELRPCAFEHDQRPSLGDHRELRQVPALPVWPHLGRERERDEVADRPGDHVAVAVEVPFAALRGAEHAGDVAGDGGLLGDDGGGHGRLGGSRPRVCFTEEPGASAV